MQEQNNIVNSLAHTKWNCKYHIVFAPKELQVSYRVCAEIQAESVL